MVDLIQKQDLNGADFVNANTLAAGGVRVRKSGLCTIGSGAPVAAPAANAPLDYYDNSADPWVHYHYDAGAWHVVGTEIPPPAAIQNDPFTALADVATLTDAARGLSLGEVNIPIGRDLTVAEMSVANAARVTIPMLRMLPLFTNKGDEPADATGVMNTNGQLGFQTRWHTVASMSDFAATMATALRDNGATVRVYIDTPDIGGSFALPAPKYAGQIVHLHVTGVSRQAECALSPAVPVVGFQRNSSHVLAVANSLQPMIIRYGDVYTLTANFDATDWRVDATLRMFRGNTWQELDNGRCVMWGRATAGQANVIVGFTRPIAILGSTTNNEHVLITDYRGNLGGLGIGATLSWTDATNCIYAHLAEASTPTQIAVTSTKVSNDPKGFEDGLVNWFASGATLDYAAYGGMANF